MTINNKQVTSEEFASKFIETLNAGLRQMTEKAAANNESLIVGDKDGFKNVPAKELLKALDEKSSNVS